MTLKVECNKIKTNLFNIQESMEECLYFVASINKTMKKSLVYTCVCLLLAMQVNAQGRRAKVESYFIVKAGMNFSNVTATNDGRIDKANVLNAFHVGLLVDLPLAKFLSFQGGLLYTGKGTKTEVGKPGDLLYVKTTSNPMYIEMPLNLVAKLPLGFTKVVVGAGPYGAIGIAGSNNVEIQTTGNATAYSNKEIVFDGDSNTNPSPYGFGNLKRFDYGMNILGGLEFSRFTATVNYSIGFTNIFLGSSNTKSEINKYRIISFSFGIIL